MDKLLRKIVKEKGDCVFVSPHLDDAILSCGSVLLNLKGKKDAVIINVFTRAHKGPYTVSAQKFLDSCGNYQDATKLYEKRIKEDKIVLSKLKVKIINLGLQDALFRRKKRLTLLGKFIPELDHLYPTYRWHAIKSVSPKDWALSDLGDALKKIVKSDAVVFAPLGIGNHADHQIANKACQKVFKKIVFYSDFPYSVYIKENGLFTKKNYKKILKKTSVKKNELIKLYQSQFSSLFPSGKIPQHEEVYYIK
ncbi:MAG: PIG-L family deacetylase [Candidatus Shapirobacteria bacterium]